MFKDFLTDLTNSHELKRVDLLALIIFTKLNTRPTSGSKSITNPICYVQCNNERDN